MTEDQIALQRIGLSPLQVIVDEIGRMRRALDAIYNDDTARAAVIKHYGLHHIDVSECVAALRKQLEGSASNGGVPVAPSYRHIGYAKYTPTADGGSLLICCGPDEPGAFRMFRNTADGVAPASSVAAGTRNKGGADAA